MRPTTDELITAVAEIRHWQKEFFRTRSKVTLFYAKKYERMVDKLLIEQGNQRILF